MIGQPPLDRNPHEQRSNAYSDWQVPDRPRAGHWSDGRRLSRVRSAPRKLAQDSGGAIQGAVRADYLYGFGQIAQTQASRTKERLRMWVLLPKGLRIAAQQTSLKTRGGAPAASDEDCLVSDPVLCVHDAP
ncbi:3D domain-containing protein [Paraburkholderia sp. BR14374]|uniref:3D domain-containing protein n=1 Tax=Paraburkholderia sp. BR14374 TaxID=3237007 RepID=UPI0034CEF492